MSNIILNNGSLHQIGSDFTPNIYVIAKALSFINRYGGHVGMYSVAQHSCLVAANIESTDPLVKLSALLHDVTEAYLGDVVAPIKRLIPEYVKIENHYHNVIDAYYGIETQSPNVKDADLRMLVTEAKSFGLPLEHFPSYKPYTVTISQRWEPHYAEQMFLHFFAAIQLEINQKSDIK